MRTDDEKQASSPRVRATRTETDDADEETMVAARRCDCTAARIRAWARRGGLRVADRGRLSWQVHELYHDAHPTEPAPAAPQGGTRPAAGAWPRAGLASLLAVSATAVVAVPAAAADDPPALVQVTGAPLVHHFDLGTPGDAVTGLWQVAASTADPVPYDGVLRPYGAIPESLAGALHVQYGQLGPGGQVATWHDAGTLADPVSYADAVPTAAVVRADAPATIPVRVSLPEPSLVTGMPGEPLAVEAAFTVSSLGSGPSTGGAAPGSGGTTASHLATTGLSSWIAALAAAFLTLGVLVRSGRRPAGDAG